MAISGCRVFTEKQYAPPASAIQELADYEIAWISDATAFSLVDPAIKAVFAPKARVVGPALTVKTMPGDFLPVPSALDIAQPGDVLVIDSRGCAERAVWGDYFTGWAREVGLAAVVIDGATRDRTGIQHLEYPVYARWTTSRAPTLQGPGEVNVPVCCGGLVVSSGDVVVLDREGIAVVGSRDLDRSLEALRGKLASERSLPQPSKEAWPKMSAAMASRSGPPELVGGSWGDPHGGDDGGQ